MGDRVEAQYRALRANFRRIERREWWLWASAFVITLLLTIALASFLLPGAYFHKDFTSQHVMSQAMRQVVNVFLNIPDGVWPTIAKNQSRIAGLTPELGKNPARAPLRVGLDT